MYVGTYVFMYMHTHYIYPCIHMCVCIYVYMYIDRHGIAYFTVYKYMNTYI